MYPTPHTYIKLQDINIQLQGTDIQLQGTNIPLQGTDIQSQGTNIQLLQGTDIYIQGTNIQLQGTDLQIQGTNMQLQGTYIRQQSSYGAPTYRNWTSISTYFRATEPHQRANRHKIYIHESSVQGTCMHHCTYYYTVQKNYITTGFYRSGSANRMILVRYDRETQGIHKVTLGKGFSPYRKEMYIFSHLFVLYVFNDGHLAKA